MTSNRNGGLPIPDLDLFGEVVGVWWLLREREKRADLGELARDYLGLPREQATRNKPCGRPASQGSPGEHVSRVVVRGRFGGVR